MMDDDEWEYLVSPRHHHHHHHHHHELIYYDQPPAFLDHEVTSHPPPPHDHLPPPHPNKTATLFPTTSSGGDGDEEILLLVKMDHFICPPPPSSSTTRSPSPPHQKDRDGVIPEIRRLSLNIAEIYRDSSDVSHLVFYRKMMETQQFVDMKLEKKENSSSPTSPTHQLIPSSDPQQQTKITGATTIGFAVQEQVDSPDLNKYEQEEEDPITTTNSIWQQTEGEKATSAGGGGRRSSSLLNIWWKRGFTGIGALCSFGVAATTISIVLFTTPHHRHTATRFHHPHHLHTPHQHERMKQVAQQAAAIGVLNLKDATISAAAARVPLGISFGGGAYHDGR